MAKCMLTGNVNNREGYKIGTESSPNQPSEVTVVHGWGNVPLVSPSLSLFLFLWDCLLCINVQVCYMPKCIHHTCTCYYILCIYIYSIYPSVYSYMYAYV